MAGAKFEARASDDILQDMWEKMTLLSALAGATCLMRAPVGAIVAAPGGGDFMRAMVAECVAVATAAGRAPRPNFLERMSRMLSDPASILAASMLRDIERGGPTEGDHVLGDMAARARAAEIAAPQLALASLHLAVYERRRSAAQA
jgi:2-dehydropantoate 2-reductase